MAKLGGTLPIVSAPGATLGLRTDASGHVRIGFAQMAERQVVLIDATAGIGVATNETADDADRQGALTPADGASLVAGFELALVERVPAVLMLASSGADLSCGVAALAGWGEAARAMVRCSGVVPMIVGVTGPAVSGPALLLGLADVVVMSTESYAFVSGPVPVRQMTGVVVSAEELGGASTHGTATGVAHLVVPPDEVADAVCSVVACLPDHSGALAPMVATSDPTDRATDDAAEHLPTSATGGYDVRDLAASIVDDGDLVELSARWAPNLVTAFASVGGHRCGIVANQPIAIAGTLDIAASQKGAAFVALCDAFNVPLLTLVDTPGFYPGKDTEWRGMIRHGAQLAFAYGRATVPRICLVLRKSYGGAYIVMDSKTMGNDVCLAWPTAELAVMGAEQSAEILLRGATDDERARYVSEYEQTYLNPYVAAERGYVDAVISPAQTRRQIGDLLDLLSHKRERLPRRRHDNTPL